MTILATALSTAGFLCLCASMRQHQQDLLHRRLGDRPTRWLRVIGFLLLAWALAVDLLAVSLERGAIYWCGHLTVGALATVATLEVRRRTQGERP